MLYDKLLESKICEHEVSYKYIYIYVYICIYIYIYIYVFTVIGKVKFVNSSLPKHLVLNNKNIFDKKPLQTIAPTNSLSTLD